MKNRYRLISRGSRGGAFYCVDSSTGKRTSLGACSRDEAEQIILAKNQSLRQPALNLQIARAYLGGSDEGVATRTWQHVMDEIPKLKKGETRARWLTAMKDRAFDAIRHLCLLETKSDHILRVLEEGTVSTNVFLRRIHNFALDMNWLPWPIVPKKCWPNVKYKQKRAITQAEHEAIIAREPNHERKIFYKLAWHLEASQSDIAFLEAENVDWKTRVISFARKKTGSIAIMRFDDEVAAILSELPQNGPLFPYVRHKIHVMLTTDTDFARFKERDSFNYFGGFYEKFPVRLFAKHSGYWNLTIDVGEGYEANIRYTINVIRVRK